MIAIYVIPAIYTTVRVGLQQDHYLAPRKAPEEEKNLWLKHSLLELEEPFEITFLSFSK